VTLDTSPLVLTSDPDYRVFYQAVVDKATEYHRQMHEA
jgi:hypothetical protein